MMSAETKDGAPVELFKPVGGFGSFDDNFSDVSKYYPDIDELYKKLMDKKEGVYAEAGYKTVVLGGMMGGMLAHEAVGHTVEADLVRALEEVPTRTAVLDVTFPEPPEAGHPFYTLPNVILTPHLAGSHRREVARMGEYMAEEFERVMCGQAPRWQVTEKMLETMA